MRVHSYATWESPRRSAPLYLECFLFIWLCFLSCENTSSNLSFVYEKLKHRISSFGLHVYPSPPLWYFRSRVSHSNWSWSIHPSRVVQGPALCMERYNWYEQTSSSRVSMILNRARGEHSEKILLRSRTFFSFCLLCYFCLILLHFNLIDRNAICIFVTVISGGKRGTRAILEKGGKKNEIVIKVHAGVLFLFHLLDGYKLFFSLVLFSLLCPYALPSRSIFLGVSIARRQRCSLNSSKTYTKNLLLPCFLGWEDVRDLGRERIIRNCYPRPSFRQLFLRLESYFFFPLRLNDFSIFFSFLPTAFILLVDNHSKQEAK